MKLTPYLAGAALALAAFAAQATTYVATESFDGATADLSITTDGVIGTLSDSDIVSWNIALSDSSGSIDLTPSNSQVDIYQGRPGPALTATPTQLLFDFTPTYSWLLFESEIGGSGAFWCAGGAGCFPGNSTAPAIGLSTVPGENPVELEAESGVVAIASVVPEPSAWVLMIAGVAGVGLMSRRARKTIDLHSRDAATA